MLAYIWYNGIVRGTKNYIGVKIMNMKKVIAAVLAAALVLSLAGCGNNETSGRTSAAISKTDGTSSAKGTNSVDSPSSAGIDGSNASESTSSVPDSKPTEVDWSSVPEIDEMNLDYDIVECKNLKWTDDIGVPDNLKDSDSVVLEPV